MGVFVPPPADQEPTDAVDELVAGTRSADLKSAGRGKKGRNSRPQIIVRPETIELIHSLIAQVVGIPDHARAEERGTYRYTLSQRRKRLNRLQRELDSEDRGETEGGAEAGKRVQKQTAPKR